jgi:hypothetical protein
MWTVLYVAPGMSMAQRLKELMETEGIMVQLRPLGFGVADKTPNIEILVPESEIEEAQEVLTHGLQR